MEKPEYNNTNMQPPATVSKTPTDLENQTPSWEGTLENNPHLLKTSQFTLAPHGLKQEKCQGTFLYWKKIGQSLQTTITLLQLLLLHQDPHKDRSLGPGTIHTHFNGSTEVRKVWMGTNCPICKNLEEDWDGDHQKQFQQLQQPQAQCPQTQNYQNPPSFPERHLMYLAGTQANWNFADNEKGNGETQQQI